MAEKQRELSKDYKAKGTKLIRIRAKAAGNKITFIKISGDFFIYPEEAITKIEENLVGAELKKGVIAGKVNKIKAELVGISAEDIEKAILE